MFKIISEIKHTNPVYNHFIYEEPMHHQASFYEDAHNDCELLFFLRGDATYIIEDKRYKLKPYDLVIIRPSKYHYIQIDGNREYERYNLLFSPALIGQALFDRIPTDREVINCTENERIRSLFSKADVYAGFGEDALPDILPGLLKELFYNLIYTNEDPAHPTAHVSPIVGQALTYINEHLYTIEDIREISSALFVTETYFFRIFKEQMNISPKKYITSKRLLAAEQRIAAGERPTDVYLSCGFNTYTAFYKRYVDFFGKSPSER